MLPRAESTGEQEGRGPECDKGRQGEEGRSHGAEHKACGIGRGGVSGVGSTMPLCLCYSLSMRCLPGSGKQPDETVNTIVIHGKRKE